MPPLRATSLALMLALMLALSGASACRGRPADDGVAQPAPAPPDDTASPGPQRHPPPAPAAGALPPDPPEGSGDTAVLPHPAALLAPTPAPVAGHTLAPVRCAVHGDPLQGAVGFEVVRAIAAHADWVWLIDRDANLRRYRAQLGPDTGCALVPDRDFGADGVFDAPRDLLALSIDGAGRLYASSGIFETWLFDAGATTPVSSCADPGHGYLTASPDGTFALGRFLGRDLRRVDFTPGGCTGAVWPHAPVFASVQAIGFAHGLTVIGGVGAEESTTGRVTQLLALRGESPAWRQGGAGDAFAEDAYSWIHAVHGCGPDVCVLDAHAGALHVVDTSGGHLARVDAGPLFGHPQPVVSAMGVASDGTGWFAVAQERGPDTAWFDGYVYRVPSL